MPFTRVTSMSMRGRILNCGVIFLVLGGDIATAGTPATPPTATEVFHLRSECGRLGEQIKEKNDLGTYGITYVFSNYNQMNNRCYVLLKYWFFKSQATQLYLYDGQGGGIFASWVNNNANVHGDIRGNPVAPSVAYEYIMKMMDDGPTENNNS
jgi:hypothetical protein